MSISSNKGILGAFNIYWLLVLPLLVLITVLYVYPIVQVLWLAAMNEAIAMPGAWVVPKGNPAGRKAVMEFIAASQKPERQVAMFKCHGMTPSNPEAFSMIPDELRRFAITLPENFKKVIAVDSAWWAANGGKAVNAYLEAIG